MSQVVGQNGCPLSLRVSSCMSKQDRPGEYSHFQFHAVMKHSGSHGGGGKLCTRADCPEAI